MIIYLTTSILLLYYGNNAKSTLLFSKTLFPKENKTKVKKKWTKNIVQRFSRSERHARSKSNNNIQS